MSGIKGIILENCMCSGNSPEHRKQSYMARPQLNKVAEYARKILDMVGEDEELEDWMESKIAQLADDIGEVYHKLDFEKKHHTADGEYSLDHVTEDGREKILDPVGLEDADIDNDGDVDSSDEYLRNRRDAISKAMDEELDLMEKELCARGKAAAKAKYDKYPSAYANGYAVQVCKGQKPDKNDKTKVSKGWSND